MPIRNRRNYVPAVLDTVSSQTFGDWELIFVDDSSTDGTRDWVRLSSDPRVLLIRNTNGLPGAASARNVGIDHAKGRFVAFLDSDDRWHPEKLERQLDHAYKSKHKDNCIFSSRFVLEGKGFRRVIPRRIPFPNEPIGSYVFQHGGVLQTSTLLCSNSMARSIRFRSDLPIHQDWDFCIRAQNAGYRVCMLTDTLTVYSAHGGQRISSISKLTDSLIWFEEIRNIVGRKAYWSGRLKSEAIRNPAKWSVLGTACLSLLLGRIRAWCFLTIVADLIGPEAKHRLLSLIGNNPGVSTF